MFREQSQNLSAILTHASGNENRWKCYWKYDQNNKLLEVMQKVEYFIIQLNGLNCYLN